MVFQKRRRVLPLKVDQVIDYKDIGLIRTFLNEYGKIMPRRSTHLNLKQQRQLARSVKRARTLKLLPYGGKEI